MIRPVRSRGLRRPRALALLAAFILLFAPAPDERPDASNRSTHATIGARILAPAVREGNTSAGPKLKAVVAQVEDQRSTEPVYPALAAAIAIPLFLYSFLGAGLRSGKREGLFGVRGLVPRGPPLQIA
jgi:hypothetical protein